MGAIETLMGRMQAGNTLACCGLDPDLVRIPEGLAGFDAATPEEQVFAALKSSRMRQDSLLVSTIGVLCSAKLALSGDAEELGSELLQDLRSIQARLDMLSSLPPIKGPDETKRLAIAVQSALKPLSPLYAPQQDS